jgi:diacylglycerol kinase family enzyme
LLKIHASTAPGDARAAGSEQPGESQQPRLAFEQANAKVLREISQKDLIGARLGLSNKVGGMVEDPISNETIVSIAALLPVKGLGGSPCRRKLMVFVVACASHTIASACVQAIRTFAGPPVARDRIKRLCVVVNPHGGRGRALPIFQDRVEPLLQFAGIQYDLMVTTHAGHAVEIGQRYSPSVFDGVVFVSGDGTVQEFVSGILSRSDWRMLVRRSPICSIACGTANVLAVGLRTKQPEYAVWTIVKHKIRPLDAMLVSNGQGLRTVALCGVGWGLAAAIAIDSESYRHLGIFRYAFLKVLHAGNISMGRRRFSGTVQYSADVAMDDTALATYFSKPLAVQRRHTKQGHVEIFGESELPEQIATLQVENSVVQQYTAAPPSETAAKAISQLGGTVVQRGGGRVLGRDSMHQLPDAGIVTAVVGEKPDPRLSEYEAEQHIDKDLVEVPPENTATEDADGTAASNSVNTPDQVCTRLNGGFGELAYCGYGCQTCERNGQLRFVGSKTLGVRIQADPTAAPSPLASPPPYHFNAESVLNASLPPHSAGHTLRPSAVVLDSTASNAVTPVTVIPPSGATPAAASAPPSGQPSAPTGAGSHGRRQSVLQTIAQTAVKPFRALRPEVSVTARGFEKRQVRGNFVTVGAVNVGPDAKFTHPSDSFVDLVIAKRGTIGSTFGLLARYTVKPCGCTDEQRSSLLEYVKARTIIITPDENAAAAYQAANVDGEVLPGPGPFRIHAMPSLLTAFGEY